MPAGRVWATNESEWDTEELMEEKEEKHEWSRGQTAEGEMIFKEPVDAVETTFWF